MRGVIVLAVLASILVAAVFWVSGGDRLVLAWAMEGQREAQGGMGRALGALRAGDAAAVIPLLAVCFLYGFFHAAGPGHGKLLIGGYGAARAVGPLRLSAVALASSLAQGASAIALVGLGVWVLNWSREYMTGVAERLLQPLGFAAIALVGLWLVYRGLRGLGAFAQVVQRGHDHHDHGGHDHGGHACGHAHAPSAEAVASATSTRELAALIGAVAIRPCTGAIFLLVLTAQMGVFGWGVAGTIAMALGTASVTVAVALAAVLLRRGALAGISDGAGRFARVQPALEIAIGLTVAWIAAGLALATV
jgi:nickel/cobalt transporter (NicO) family protein